ncbi:HdeD family acid-resistance protein [Rhodococcus kronopolitis]|uniref:HdeD family acid-resistance protein n=1 Tax=Rhodococcus kronopolitis TaxID=1460226 RepID=A0ABV9FSQ7_9NOCA
MTDRSLVDSNEAILRIGKDVWWSVVLRGVIAIVFGIVALAWPQVTVHALVFVIGIYWILDGLVTAARAVAARSVTSGWMWWLLAAVVSVAAGIAVLVWPEITALVFVYMVGFWAILIGVLEVLGAFQVRSAGGAHWGWLLVAGIVAVVFGLVLVIFPGDGIIGLIKVIGVFAIIEGVLLLVAAWQVRTAAKRSGVV